VAVTVTVVVGDVEAQAEEEMMVLGWPRKRKKGMREGESMRACAAPGNR
jgi:hypothetical protein